MIGLRWAVRGLGLLNTFVLARLLSPDDFGLVAMAMLLVGLVEVLGDTGQTLALIRLPTPTRAHYDSAWTLGVLVAGALTLLLWGVAPLAPLYFHDPRAAPLIGVLALRVLIGGFENIGVVAFRRDLRFGLDFRYQVLQRLATVALTIGCAAWLRDARALVAGIIGGQAIGVALSYRLHPYRPRPCVAKIPELLGFSGWMLLVHVAQYVQDKADDMVVGGVATPAAMGLYTVSADTATAPTVEVVLPVTRALFPVFARIGSDAGAVRAAFLDVFAVACMMSVATGAGMALVARDFVAVALGPHWAAAVPLVRILAIGGGLYGIMQASVPVLSATGHARLSALLTATRAAALVPGLVAAGLLGNTVWVALTRVAITLVFIPGMLLALTRVLPVTFAELLARAWRPVAAAVPMAACVLSVHALLPDLAWLRLMLDAAVGAAIYPLSLFWALAGSPAGPEARAWQWLRRWRTGITRQ
jgi:O-antigen/teichoic acid export membrane protein